MLGDPGRILHSSWQLQYHLWSHQQVSTGSISGSQWYWGNLVYTPGGHLCHWGSSHIAWRQNQLSMDSWKSLNSSYWSDVVHSKVGVFKLVACWLGISDLRAVVRATRGSAAASAGSFGWTMTAGVQQGYSHTQLTVNSGKVRSLWDVIQGSQRYQHT